MVGQLADYDIEATVVDDGPAICLSGRRPGRLGIGGSPVTVWVLGPVTRTSWDAARPRVQQAASVRGPGLPDWLEAGVADWAQRPVVWVSAAIPVGSTLAQPPAELGAPGRLGALAEAARGAHSLHERGVLHGAICPQAIGLAGTSGVLAPPSLADGRHLTAQVGYPPLSYIDPQLVRGEGGRWSDIWGLGATLYHAVTGRCPHPGLDQLPVVQALAQVMGSPGVNLDGVPPAAAQLISACLATDPADRPPTAAELARRVDEIAAQWEGDGNA